MTNRFHRSWIFSEGAIDRRDVSDVMTVDFKETQLLSILSKDLERLTIEKIAAIKQGTSPLEDSTQILTDFTKEGELTSLKEVTRNYYEKFVEYLAIMYSWTDICYLVQLARQPFTLHKEIGAHVWSIGYEDLHHLSKDIVEFEIQNFIEEIKEVIRQHAEKKVISLRGASTTTLDDSVLLSNTEMINWISDQIALTCESKNDKAEFLFSLKSNQASNEEFEWFFDLSIYGVIKKIPRETSFIENWIDNQLDQLKPKFSVPPSKSEKITLRIHKERFVLKWEGLINSGLIHIVPIDNFIQSNFSFEANSPSSKTPYVFTTCLKDNIKQTIIEILKIFKEFKIIESKRNIALWLYFHFRDLLEYQTIEYYVYHD